MKLKSALKNYHKLVKYRFYSLVHTVVHVNQILDVSHTKVSCVIQ